MKLRELESNLQSVSGFEAPKAELEQYVTTPHLAAQLVHTMHSDFDEVEDKIVCDLGCGSGMLTLAAVMAGAQHVTGIDVDSDALALAKANVAESGCEELVDLVQADLATDVFKASKIFDTVVMNPPFGTKRKGVDILFLQTGLNLAREAVYSMHKTTTRGFIEKKFRGFGVEATVLAQMEFDIGRTYAFQKKKSMSVEVDLWRFDVLNAAALPEIGTGVSVDRPLEFIGKGDEKVYNARQRKIQYKRRGRK